MCASQNKWFAQNSNGAKDFGISFWQIGGSSWHCRRKYIFPRSTQSYGHDECVLVPGWQMEWLERIRSVTKVWIGIRQQLCLPSMLIALGRSVGWRYIEDGRRRCPIGFLWCLLHRRAVNLTTNCRFYLVLAVGRFTACLKSPFLLVLLSAVLLCASGTWAALE